MPVLTLHLLSLSGTSPEEFVKSLLSSTPAVEVIMASKPVYTVVRPTKQDVSTLDQAADFDLMLLIRAPDDNIPTSLQSYVKWEYKVFAGIPSKILTSYPQNNRKLLNESPSAGLTGSLDNPAVPDSSQNLELSPDLLSFMKKQEHRPMTMLNLLHFKPNGKPSYYQYGQNFIEVASKRGGNAKIVGNIVEPTSTSHSPNAVLGGKDTWQEIALVHYPSMTHFCDMLGGEDYQAINEKFRLPALADTLLLATVEMDLVSLRRSAKL